MKRLNSIMPLILYCILFFPSIVANLFNPSDLYQPFNEPPIMLKKIISDLFLILFFLLLLFKRLKESPKEAKLDFPPIHTLPWILFTLLAALSLSSLFLYLSHQFPLPLSSKQPSEQSPFKLQHPFWVIFLLFFSAYMEELFFRGYLIDCWKKELPIFQTMLFSSLLFSLGHINQGIWGILATFALGILFCFAKEKSQNLHIVAISHWLYNLIALFLKSFFSFFDFF